MLNLYYSQYKINAKVKQFILIVQLVFFFSVFPSHILHKLSSDLCVMSKVKQSEPIVLRCQV